MGRCIMGAMENKSAIVAHVNKHEYMRRIIVTCRLCVQSFSVCLYSLIHSFSSCFLFHCVSHGVSGQEKNEACLFKEKECVILEGSYLINY